MSETGQNSWGTDNSDFESGLGQDRETIDNRGTVNQNKNLCQGRHQKLIDRLATDVLTFESNGRQ
jgi:hypothetical protein